MRWGEFAKRSLRMALRLAAPVSILKMIQQVGTARAGITAAPMRFIEARNDDAGAECGMDKTPLRQINADMIDPRTFRRAALKKDQISRLQATFADGLAKLVHGRGVVRQVDAIRLGKHRFDQAGTIDAVRVSAAGAVARVAKSIKTGDQTSTQNIAR